MGPTSQNAQYTYTLYIRAGLGKKSARAFRAEGDRGGAAAADGFRTHRGPLTVVLLGGGEEPHGPKFTIGPPGKWPVQFNSILNYSLFLK